MADDFLNITRLETAVVRMEDYVQNVAKPAAASGDGQALLQVRAERDALQQKNTEAAERVVALMKTLKNKGVAG